MIIREAILKAADSIERNPCLFDFYTVRVPPDCHTPGCALGWIAFHWGAPSFAALVEPMDVEECAFYDRMDDLTSGGWEDDPRVCARGLRKYADRYHPVVLEQAA